MHCYFHWRTQASPFRLRMPVAALLVCAFAFGSAGAQQISPAETLLFETDHLARLSAPAALVYAFEKASNTEPRYRDEVRLDVSGDKGRKRVAVHFLSGEHKHEVAPLDEAHGNPVLLGFLERDIAEMKRLTGGSTSYFRKRIRMALADAAQVTTQTITYQGKPLQAKTVRIQPYLNDPLHARFEKYVHKTYTFVLSDRVPGGVYQLRTSLGNSGAAGPAAGTAAHGAPAAVIDETLTLVRVVHPPN